MTISKWEFIGVLSMMGLGCGGSSAQQPLVQSEPTPAAETPAPTPVVEKPQDPTPLAPPAPQVLRATVELKTLDGAAPLGTVTFEQVGSKVSVVGHFTGLTPGLHGFYVHQEGDCSGKLAANAGLHFNPSHVKHGPIGSPVRHVGDFGNLSADKDGHATFEMTTDSLTVVPGPDSVVGRALIIHARKDDGKTQPSGSAGPAMACGVIGAPGDMASSMSR
jgi:superoxide dismutase, Cu-Zn family